MIFLETEHLDKTRTIRFFNSNLDRLEKMSHFEINLENLNKFKPIRSSLFHIFSGIVNSLESSNTNLVYKLNVFVLEFFKFTNEFSPDINKDRSPILIIDKQNTLLNKLLYFKNTLSQIHEKKVID